MPRPTKYWLLKSEPDCFSIQDLAQSPKQTTFWSGVRNYQARNFLRDEIKVGDGVLFYHSGADATAIVGTAKVVREGYPDHTAMDPRADHFDPKQSAENPIWQMVDIRLVEVFAQPLTLELLRQQPLLAGMELLKRGSRLSVQPVTADEWKHVLKLAKHPPAASAAKSGAKKSAAKSKSAGVRK
jgi:predicted RNA-binding protein with PUA-like domain